MIRWHWVSRARFDDLRAELDRERNESRVLLSALLERAVSREAALMLRKPEELAVSVENMRARAKVQYEAAHPPEEHKPPVDRPDPRHWRSTRENAEINSLHAAAAANAHDSETALNQRVEEGKAS